MHSQAHARTQTAGLHPALNTWYQRHLANQVRLLAISGSRCQTSPTCTLPPCLTLQDHFSGHTAIRRLLAARCRTQNDHVFSALEIPSVSSGVCDSSIAEEMVAQGKMLSSRWTLADCSLPTLAHKECTLACEILSKGLQWWARPSLRGRISSS